MVDWATTAMNTHDHPYRSALREFWTFLVRERIVLLLLTSTFALIAWQRWGMNSTVLLEPGSKNLRISSFSDSGDGGNSICSVEPSDKDWRFNYEVHPGISWAFCGIRFEFRKNDSSPGIDLSRYETMVVNLAGVQGPLPALQTQLKSMDTNLYRKGDGVSLKYMAMVLTPESRSSSRTAMPLNYFVLPPWWVARNHVPMRFQYPDRSDVRELEFATSADVVNAGQGSVRIRSLEFHGKWIDKILLLKILFVAWISYVVAGLAWRLYKSFASIRRLQEKTTQLQDLAERDPLTRLHNRRGLENHLSGLTNRCVDPSNPTLGVMMLDLDHFKKVNDTLGHDAGDEVLRRAAKIIQDEMRPNNLGARWGGEEFIVLFPGITAARLLPVAEKLRLRIESEVQFKDMRITASIGIAHGLVDDFETLAKRADQALYRAKEGGRNQVQTADPV
jgi:diguanylate cyclase (GGDEF)-like protein